MRVNRSYRKLKIFFCILEPGEVEFSNNVYVVKESVGQFMVNVERKNGADGVVTVKYRTQNINAIGGKDYQRNFTIHH